MALLKCPQDGPEGGGRGALAAELLWRGGLQAQDDGEWGGGRAGGDELELCAGAEVGEPDLEGEVEGGGAASKGGEVRLVWWAGGRREGVTNLRVYFSGSRLNFWQASVCTSLSERVGVTLIWWRREL